MADERPAWEANALARVRSRQNERRNRNGGRKNGMYLFFDDPFRVLLDEAAARRDISLTGYGRRAVAAFIAHDLSLPLEAVLEHTARPAAYMAPIGGLMRRTQDDGTGHGLWIVGNLE